MTDHHSRLHAALYTLAALLLLGQALWLYLIGDYARILMPALLAPLLLTAALMRLGQQETARLSAYLALICGYLLVAVALPGEASLSPLWLGLPPVLTLLLLPLGPATLLNLTLTPIWLLLADNHLDADLVLAYLALVAAAGLAPWELRHHRALLQATDPRDEECAAMKRQPLIDRLHSEYERAELLNQRLAILVFHLPQLEMAGEQFGPATRQALLDNFCEVVLRYSRDHDILGRSGDADFWLVLPITTESGALLVRQRIEESLQQSVLLDIGQLEVRTSVCHEQPRETFVHLLQRLDAISRRLADA